MSQFLKVIFNKIFDFFASLKLAIFLLTALILVFAAGTILESLHGAETAKILVYDTLWLEALLLLLALNLTASALSRWPWQTKHSGFVLTHLGIILVLAGAYVTKKGVLDSQMPVEKGATEYRVFIDEPVIYLRANKNHWRLPVKRRPFAWQGVEILNAASDAKPLPFSLRVISHYPKGRLHSEIAADTQGSAAVLLQLQNSFVKQEQWLIENDENLGTVQLGPVKLMLTDQGMAHDNTAVSEDQNYLEFRWPDQVRQIPVKPGLPLPANFDLQGTPWKIRVEGVYQNAMIDKNRLIEVREDSASPSSPHRGAENPAVVLWLEGKDIQEKHTVFAKYPDFPTQHGMKPSATGARIFYRLPNGGSTGKSHELRFVPKGDGTVLYQRIGGTDFKEGTAPLGEKIETGWMGGLVFTVKTFYPHARQLRFFTPLENTSQSKRAFRAVEMEVGTGEKTKRLWLGQEMPETWEWEGTPYQAVLGQRQLPIGFKLMLRDFRVKEYPGTNRPASFESDVTLQDDFRGVQENATISMNKPLVYHGIRVFQASYSRIPGQPDVSVFAVAYDPGIWIKYAGAMVMVAGIITMFYTRRFSTSKGIE